MKSTESKTIYEKYARIYQTHVSNTTLPRRLPFNSVVVLFPHTLFCSLIHRQLSGLKLPKTEVTQLTEVTPADLLEKQL